MFTQDSDWLSDCEPYGYTSGHIYIPMLLIQRFVHAIIVILITLNVDTGKNGKSIIMLVSRRHFNKSNASISYVL